MPETRSAAWRACDLLPFAFYHPLEWAPLAHFQLRSIPSAMEEYQFRDGIVAAAIYGSGKSTKMTRR